MFSFNKYFSVQVFFIILRETLELAIIISVLLAFVDQTVKKPQKGPGDYRSLSQEHHEVNDENIQKETNRLKLSIWLGGISGFIVCLFVGAVILLIFYALDNDLWSLTEHYWEGIFSILASIIISVMGVKMLRVTKMQRKWEKN